MIDWVSVPAGSFPMGIDPAAAYPPDDDETPRRVVRVEGFRLSRVPVTGDDGVPLTYVSRADAEAFCAAHGVSYAEANLFDSYAYVLRYLHGLRPSTV